MPLISSILSTGAVRIRSRAVESRSRQRLQRTKGYATKNSTENMKTREENKEEGHGQGQPEEQ